MNRSKLRRQITWEAARLMYDRQESEYYTAKMKAARQICKGWVKPADLPSNAEIRDEIQSFARLHEGDRRTARLKEMRLSPDAPVEAFSTPRRLTARIGRMPERQEDLDESITGPPVSAAFNAAGEPTPAALGFAKKQGVPFEAVGLAKVATSAEEARDLGYLRPGDSTSMARETPSAVAACPLSCAAPG